jgi:hypothetical protein
MLKVSARQITVLCRHTTPSLEEEILSELKQNWSERFGQDGHADEFVEYHVTLSITLGVWGPAKVSAYVQYAWVLSREFGIDPESAWVQARSVAGNDLGVDECLARLYLRVTELLDRRAGSQDTHGHDDS